MRDPRAQPTITHLLERFRVQHTKRQPIEVPNVGRNDLAAILTDLGFTRGVELGVQKGEYSETLCRANPSLKLWSVDLWRARRGYVDLRVPQEEFDRWEAEARQRLGKYPNCAIVKADTIEATKLFEDRSLDFVYVDADHSFLPCIGDIAAWTPKVRIGGILAGHDFAKINHPGRRRYQGAPGHRVVPALLGWTMAYDISPWFVLGTKDIVPGVTRDLQRSWCWVVE